MSVKTHLSFLKDMLYIAEISACGTISRAAEKNGIKASNLSKLIKDAEKEFSCHLFLRTNKGLIPTKTALEISQRADEICKLIEKSEDSFLQNGNNKPVLFYISEGLEIVDLNKVCQNAVLTENIKQADIIITTQKPDISDKMLCVHIKIGQNIMQNIWICGHQTPQTAPVITRLVLMFQH